VYAIALWQVRWYWSHAVSTPRSTVPRSDRCVLSAIKRHFCLVNDAQRYSKACGLLVPYCVMAGTGDPHPVDCSTASPPHLTTSWNDRSLVFIHFSIHILWTFAFTFLSINFSYLSGSLLCSGWVIAFRIREIPALCSETVPTHWSFPSVHPIRHWGSASIT
jgi:hypothetical protein